MARIPYPDRAVLDPRAQQALAAAPPLNIFRLLAHSNRAFSAYTRFGAAVLTKMTLDPKLRELAILEVARHERAEYEWVQHVDLALALGVLEGQIAAVAGGPPYVDGRFSQTEQAILEFTTAVLRSPEVADEVFARVSDQLPPHQIVELLMAIGNYLMLARVMTVLQIEPDPPMGAAVLEASTGAPRT